MMAESMLVEPPNSSRYFCYPCSQEISPVHPGLICPNCQGGFVEELPQESEDASFSSEFDTEDLSFIEEMTLDGLIDRALQRSILNLGQQGMNMQRSSVIERSFQTLLDEFDDMRIEDDEDASSQPMQNFGDYAIGTQWDALITQFLNEADTSGPSPLPKEQIENLPNTKITDEHVDNATACSICMDDFVFNENVKLLPCEHFYHKRCIVPWLEQHATCPVCRKEVKITAQKKRSQSCPRSQPDSSSDQNRRRSSSNSNVCRERGFSLNPFRYF